MSYYEAFGNVIYWLDDVLWSKPFIIFVLLIGMYFFFGSGIFTLRHLGHIMKCTFGQVLKGTGTETERKEGQVSPFEAACIAIGGCVGSGNIAGVATAIATGGPGAVFWLEVWAFFGMMVKCVEVSLSVHYRGKNEKDEYFGGTTYMMEKGFGRQMGHMGAAMVVAVIFAVGFICQFLGGSQAYSISEVLNRSFGIDMMLVTVLYSIVLYYVIWKGTPRIAKVATRLVPFMCVIYLLGGIILIIANIGQVPSMIAAIFHDAFTGSAAAGGFAGAAVQQAISKGLSRSINSNEAGQGSSPQYL